MLQVVKRAGRVYCRELEHLEAVAKMLDVLTEHEAAKRTRHIAVAFEKLLSDAVIGVRDTEPAPPDISAWFVAAGFAVGALFGMIVVLATAP